MMSDKLAFGWTIYITYYRIDPLTKKRISKPNTVRHQFESKVECENFIRFFSIPTREVIGFTILDGF
ncbi:unnamed protein product, partial [marine sediment metagenome]